MRRIGWIMVGTALAALALFLPGRLASPQAAVGSPSPSPARSPLTGAWLVSLDLSRPSQPPAVVVFMQDGLAYQSNANGTDGAGAWQATGPRTAILTLKFPESDAQGRFTGTRIVRATVTVDASGQHFTADHTIEFVAASGQSTGQLGPGRAAGTRIVAEAPGTPVGTPPTD